MHLYNILILPHINYGILLWGAKVNKDHKMPLLQKKSVRLITSKHCMAHSESIFKDLRILMIHDIYYLSIVKFYYKLTNGHLSDCFDHFKPNVSTGCSRYPIRNPTMQCPIIRHEYARYTLHYQLIRVMNDNSNCILLPVNVNNFIWKKLRHIHLWAAKYMLRTLLLNHIRTPAF